MHLDFGIFLVLKRRTQLTLLHSEWTKLHRVLAILSEMGLMAEFYTTQSTYPVVILEE